MCFGTPIEGILYLQLERFIPAVMCRRIFAMHFPVLWTSTNHVFFC